MSLTQRCKTCGKSKILEKHFSKNKFSENGYSTICKSCRSKISTLDEFKLYLIDNNIEFKQNTWDEAKRQVYNKLENEFKNKDMPSEDKIIKKIIGKYGSLGNLVGGLQINKKKDNKDFDNENISSDLKVKWGSKYSEDEYLKLEDFYSKMKDFNKIETPQDEFYLKKLAVISLKMDKELEDGNYAQVKQLGDLFSKYMADSKFRAMDLTDASKSGGIRTFSHIYAEVERDDFIPPWEQYRVEKNLKQDIVDKTIMYILNYTLKLNKIPQMITPPEDTPKIEE